MRFVRKILNHALIIVSAGTIVQADPRDLLQEFLERDAVISQRVISKEASLGDVGAEREALIGEINGRLAGEGYQLGWTQNFGIERELEEARGWKIYPGQGYVYDAESGIVSGKGFILSQTFERGIFGDLPIIVGGSYDRVNRESAFRLNIIHDKTLLGPLVTKHLNTQVFAPEAPIEGSEVTVQFLNGAYQPLQVCARILSAGILIPKKEKSKLPPTLKEVEAHSHTYRRILDLAMKERTQRLDEVTLSTGDTIRGLEQQLATAEEYGTPDQVQVVQEGMREGAAYKASVDDHFYRDKDYLCVLIQTALEEDRNCLKATSGQIERILRENGLLPDEVD